MTAANAPLRPIVTSTTLRLLVDAVVFSAYVLLLSPRLTGLPLHEWLGLSFSVPVFSLHFTLFLLIVLEVFSGILISQVAMPRMGFMKLDDRSWRALHNQTLNWILLCVGLHVAMNWQWIVRALRRRATVTVPGDSLPGMSSTRLVSIVAGGLFVLLAAASVCVSAFFLIGRPSAQRVYHQNEIARFTPTAGHGIGQLVGEASLLCLVAFIGRRWLRVRM